jgi:hypothetical protein
MDVLLFRLVLILGFVAYMAAIYLALHMIFAHFIRSPESRSLWFFSVVTGPLTYPVRRFLPLGTSDARVRWIALAVYVALWLVTKMLVVQLRGAAIG